MSQVTFKQIDQNLAQQLIDFMNSRNIGKSIVIDNIKYTLEHISLNKNQFFGSRGLSVYYKTGKSIIRISDHWAKSKHYDRSRKLNCGLISGKNWCINNKPDTKVYCSTYAGKYAFEMLAGIAGLSKLNKTCDHFK